MTKVHTQARTRIQDKGNGKGEHLMHIQGLSNKATADIMVFHATFEGMKEQKASCP